MTRDYKEDNVQNRISTEGLSNRNQNDLASSNYAKLNYDIAKKQIDLEKNFISMQQKLEFEQKIYELKIRYQTYLQMMSCVVYEDAERNLMFAVTDYENKSVVTKRLLNVKNFKARIIIVHYPVKKMAVEVIWGEETTNRLVFPYDDGIQPNVFLRKLKGKGVLFLVSGRTEKSAVNALLAYIFENAEVVELPAFHGWVKMGDEKWHFVSKSERTFMEVLNNV